MFVFLSLILCTSVFAQNEWVVGNWKAEVQGTPVSATFTSTKLTLTLGYQAPITDSYKMNSSQIMLSDGTMTYTVSSDKNSLNLNFGGGNIIPLKRVKETPTATAKPSTSSGSASWNKLLIDYEAYVDKYIVLYKKAMAGDAGAMSEYASFYEKSLKLQESLEEVGDDMSEAQMAKYMKITMKMMDAFKY